jgi:hypothetical protein
MLGVVIIRTLDCYLSSFKENRPIALPSHARCGANTITIIMANDIFILCVIYGIAKTENISTGILAWMKILHCVCDCMLDNVNHFLTICLSGWSRSMRGKECACLCSHKKRGDCCKNEGLLHGFISFE